MTDAKANGERFVAIADDLFLPVQKVAHKLREQMSTKVSKVPTRQLPNFSVKVIALFDPMAAVIERNPGKKTNATNQKAKSVLGWQPRSADEALKATAESLHEFGLVKS